MELSEETEEELDWGRVRPVLDEAIGELKNGERDIICLRFYENQRFKEIGEKLGVAENTARMRLSRTLEKLHGLLSKRGISSSAATLAIALGGQASTVAPLGLAQLVSSTAIAGIGGVSLVSTVIGFMNTTKAIVTVSGIVSVVVLGTAVILNEEADDSNTEQNLETIVANADTRNGGGSKMERETDIVTPIVDMDSPSSVEGEIDTLKRRLGKAKVELEKLTRPFGESVSSSTVSAVIREGETLVTGGYLTEDGNHEVTFFTPNVVTLGDGSQGIQSTIRIVSVGPDFVVDSGLDSLATNARNTLQHAEAWAVEDVRATLAFVKEYESTFLLSAPFIVSREGSKITMRLLSEGGQPYTLEAKVDRTDNGDFVVDARIERPDRVQIDQNP